ncbi:MULTISPECIES: GNAT family N-acetyltransferase [Planktothricoides]|uniref:GNAT family N-acetyltransferase n=2 Tax=Planktothricoides raciborskii TaxID=132608 RepID=A0AAU8JAM6_9CYAN|nr:MULTISPECIES: GNAT family N-acetyltransferase [Planktothricoides]MBD2542988.1 GNAT family N-acetyltransferase [Planktothricoides raciborskii FACHB-1370]MBD2581866.1 GNAT family N-acetyltransferase [Planktothricoides raciborskii FACHB-1261]
MSVSLHRNRNVTIRPLQQRDLEAVEHLLQIGIELETPSCSIEKCSLDIHRQFQPIRTWYGLLRLFSLFPNPLQHLLCARVAERDNQILGLIQIAPFNSTRSTWRVERVVVDPGADHLLIGSMLLRHCLEAIWEARMWLLEVNVNDKDALALYRHNGFQPLAQMTYWAIAPELLTQLTQREPDLPNLLPVSNADAHLLCQLDIAAMPPLVRQVFERHKSDFQTSFFQAILQGIRQWLDRTEVVSGYVFEPQRKAAIGHFQLRLCKDGSFAHRGSLTVHPAYTWLYPEILSQMARIAKDLPPQSLQLASADYQPEREEYLEQIRAERIEHTMLMSRSVWHKLRESKRVALDALQLTDMLPGLSPVRKPIPSRITWWGSEIESAAPCRPPESSRPNIEDSRQCSTGDEGQFSS